MFIASNPTNVLQLGYNFVMTECFQKAYNSLKFKHTNIQYQCHKLANLNFNTVMCVMNRFSNT